MSFLCLSVCLSPFFSLKMSSFDSLPFDTLDSKSLSVPLKLEREWKINRYIRNLFKMFPLFQDSFFVHSFIHFNFCSMHFFPTLSNLLPLYDHIFPLFLPYIYILCSLSFPFSFQYALLQIVVEACQKKSHCKFLASSRTMNNDPCPETAKFIEIAYKCRPCK